VCVFGTPAIRRISGIKELARAGGEMAPPLVPCAAGDWFVLGPARARTGRSLNAYLRRCGTGFTGMSG
jgi:hypothetical protein